MIQYIEGQHLMGPPAKIIYRPRFETTWQVRGEELHIWTPVRIEFRDGGSWLKVNRLLITDIEHTTWTWVDPKSITQWEDPIHLLIGLLECDEHAYKVVMGTS